MMAQMDETTGQICEKMCSFFEWKIPNVFSFSDIPGEFLSSPEFEFANNTWFLRIYTNGYDRQYSEWISLYLRRRNPECSETISYTMGIKSMDGKNYLSKDIIGHTFAVNEASWGWHEFLKRSELLQNEHKIAPGDVLTIFCITSCEKAVEKVESENSTDITVSEKAEKLSQDLKILFLSKQDSDVTLNVKQREFRAHKAILGARSPVFSSMFKHDMVEKSSGVVDINDCDPDVFQDFLLYMYSGEVEKLSTSNALGLYLAADKYDAQELKKECTEIMKKELSVDTFCDVIALAAQHNESVLVQSTTNFFVKNCKQIAVTVKWQSFLRENPIVANELYLRALENFTP